MKKFGSVEYIGSLASIIALAFFLYYQYFAESNLELEVLDVSVELVTQQINDESLTANYYYKGDSVEYLYRMEFSIFNSSDETIIGIDGKSIIGDSLSILTREIPTIGRILDVKKSNATFPVDLINFDALDNLSLRFKQWRKGESIELISYISTLKEIEKNELINFIIIDERDIFEGSVFIQELSDTNNMERKKLVDYLPKWLRDASWWIIMLTCVGMYLAVIAQAVKDEEYNGAYRLLYYIFMLVIFTVFLFPLLWIISV